LKLLLAILLVIALGSAAFSADIVTMPTANQLKKGNIDLAYYHLWLDNPEPMPQAVNAETLYLGLTNHWELDFHAYQVDNDKDSVIGNVSYLLMHETPKQPDVVVGVRNLFGESTTNNPALEDLSADQSFFLCTAKTFMKMTPKGPKFPIVRLHACVGTKDWTLLGEERHEGLFGGVQALLAPEIGAIVLYDGQDVITGLTYTPKSKGLTFKGGTFGDAWWFGISYLKESW
jgi:hypothetical protein